jgi:hypothetical protein
MACKWRQLRKSVWRPKHCIFQRVNCLYIFTLCPGLRIESFAVINLRGVSTNKTIIKYLSLGKWSWSGNILNICCYLLNYLSNCKKFYSWFISTYKLNGQLNLACAYDHMIYMRELKNCVWLEQVWNYGHNLIVTSRKIRIKMLKNPPNHGYTFHLIYRY